MPLPGRRAYEALVADIAAAELVPEWMIEKAARNGGVDGTRRPPTPRQVEYAQGYANGESGNEVAHRLGVKMESVSRAFERLQFNLDARSRYQAVAMLVFAGYITAPPMPAWTKSGRGERAQPRKTQMRRPVRELGSLPPRQQQVLQLIADGLSNEEVAGRLGISDETVKSFLRLIFRNLDARNRGHAIAIGIRSGLIT